MNEKELQEKLNEIRDGMKLFDTMINKEGGLLSGGKEYLTEKQADIVRSLFDVFKALNWQLAFNEYRELQYEESKPIDTRNCGTPVKVRPCGEEFENKTFFGILIGDVPLSLGASIEPDGVVMMKRTMYNPAIFIPELQTVVYGAGSWWGEIASKEELDKLITDEVIENTWYVKLLQRDSHA